jgi:hypothetical protein
MPSKTQQFKLWVKQYLEKCDDAELLRDMNDEHISKLITSTDPKKGGLKNLKKFKKDMKPKEQEGPNANPQ